MLAEGADPVRLRLPSRDRRVDERNRARYAAAVGNGGRRKISDPLRLRPETSLISSSRRKERSERSRRVETDAPTADKAATHDASTSEADRRREKLQRASRNQSSPTIADVEATPASNSSPRRSTANYDAKRVEGVFSTRPLLSNEVYFALHNVEKATMDVRFRSRRPA